MSKNWMSICLAVLVTVTLWFAPMGAALATGDAAVGGKIFAVNCAACHVGGGNVVNGVKTLRKEALEQFEMYDLAKVQTQVTNGKNAMPSFKGKLTEADIENVATYVLSQADAGW
jgi:cytochrome c6